MLVEDFREPDAARRVVVLAWKFNIWADAPESRAWVYVNARSGAVVLQDAIIKHSHAAGSATTTVRATAKAATAKAAAPAAAPRQVRGSQTAATGRFDTRYMGVRQVATDQTATGFRLRDYTRAAGIETYNLRNNTAASLANGIDFTDADNNWTALEFNNTAKDNAALDAHFGSTQVYDYWLNTHNRNSWNGLGGKMINYIHFRTGYDNASWNGSAMQYGDGGSLFTPLTCLDVCAHEMGHGICQATAGLVYQNESGALNEGFSDIWGACVEHFADSTKQTWVVGEDISRTSGGLRSMSDPLSAGVLTSCPANYRGRRWNFGTSDNGGVHTNSGVLNHWFYILSVGKQGVNEQRQAYAVTGVGIARAARIAYRAERLYLTPTSDFRSMRIFSIQAATDLYGATSAEVQAVIDAWYAVGLGPGSAAPAGQQAQCAPDDAPVLTASASTLNPCAGVPLILTATATMPAVRRLRNAVPVALVDGSTNYTAVPLFSSITTVQHGLESFYTDYASFLRKIHVRILHPRPQQVALRLALRSGNTTVYVPLATALPAYTGNGTAILDLTFDDNATGTLPATLSGNALTGTFRPSALFSSITPAFVTTMALEGLDGQVGSAGTVELAELFFARDASDQPTLRWVGPGLDVAGASATVTPASSPTGGATPTTYTALASDPYFGCTSQQTLTVTVRQPLLAAAALQPGLCAGRGQAFGPLDLRVTQDDSLPGQTYRWTGPAGYAATGKRQRVARPAAGRLRYVVATTAPGSSCALAQTVTVLARRPAAAVPAGIDSVVVAGTAARLRSRALDGQLVGPYRFAGSTNVPDNNPAGVRIPIVVAGTPESFFELRGIRLSATNTYIGDMEFYVEAPDGTRVLLSKQNGADGDFYTNTLFVDSVGAPGLGAGGSPYAGSWQVDEPTGFAKLNAAAQVGTWNLWARDIGPQDLGRVTAWAIVTKDNRVLWSGPNGFTATGPATLSPVLNVPGHYRYLATTTSGPCTYPDTVNVRVTRSLATRNAVAGLSLEAAPVPFGDAGLVLHLQAAKAVPTASVAVFDLAGRLLVRRALVVPAGASALALPETGGLPAGVYLVRAQLGAETLTLRVARE